MGPALLVTSPVVLFHEGARGWGPAPAIIHSALEKLNETPSPPHPTAPDGIAAGGRKVETDQPGLYGLGCATFTRRPTLVCKAVDDYLDPCSKVAIRPTSKTCGT